MRPQSIVLFDRLYLGWIALGVINFFLSYDIATAMMRADSSNLVLGVSPESFYVVIAIVSVLVQLLLWYFIARMGSNVARWIWIILFALGMINVAAMFEIFEYSVLLGTIGLIIVGMQVFGIFLLFRPESNAWFKGEWDGDVTETFE